MSSIQLKSIRPHAQRAFRRLRLVLNRKRHSAVPIFVLGTQRSGTKMLLRTLERSDQIWAHDHRPRDLSHLLRPDPAYRREESGSMARLVDRDALRSLIESSPTEVLAFHAIAESQNGDTLLHDFERGRIIWVYRRYADVANSALDSWGDHQKDLIKRVHERNYAALNWRCERVPEEVQQQVGDLYDPAMAPFDASCLFWYMRNQFFFELGLDREKRVFLVQYEDFVTDPKGRFRMLFDWIGVPFDESLVDHIFSSSIGKRKVADPVASTAALCDPLLARLDTAYEAQLDRLR
ncbi:sulfotransferase domain-containing protein [Bacteroidota bacterium]